MLAGDPGHGGATWAVLQYVLGLSRLGHDVWFVEPAANVSGESQRYFADVVAAHGLEDRAVLGELSTGNREAIRSADLLLNIAGMLVDEAVLATIPVRVYLDLDPAFTQLWQAVEGIDMRLEGHTHFATVGQRIGEIDCEIPACDVAWIRTLPPVVLDHWPVASQILYDGLTTVGNWRSYGSIQVGEVNYGQRAHSVRELLALPTLTEERIMPALAIHPDERSDLDTLAANGWHLLDPSEVAATPATYRSFVQGSKAELGVAKKGYVVSRCGWFSDRSACYLASGRPVLAQDTGFRAALPTGEGLLAFSTVDEAAAGIEEICARYSAHAVAARELAETYLDSGTVLTRLLECL